MSRKILSLMLCFSLVIALGTWFYASGKTVVTADDFTLVENGGGDPSIVKTENGLQISGTKADVYNFRYLYNEKVPIKTDGDSFTVKFSIDEAGTYGASAWLFFSLTNGAAMGGWGPNNFPGMVNAFRISDGDFLSSLSYTDGNYPIHSLQINGSVTVPGEYTMTVAKEGTAYKVYVNGALMATHSAAPDAFAWLDTEAFGDGATLSITMFNVNEGDTAPVKITLKEINGVPCDKLSTEPSSEPSSSSETSSTPSESSSTSSETSSEPSEPSSSEPTSSQPGETSDKPIDKLTPVNAVLSPNQKKVQMDSGIKLSGSGDGQVPFNYAWSDKLDVAGEGVKLELSFDAYHAANNFFIIALTDIPGWGPNGWANNNPHKGVIFVVRPVDSWTEIHTMKGNEWPEHVGDMNKGYEIVKGKSLTFEIKKVGGVYKVYIDGVEMTQFKDNNYNLSQYLDNGAYLTVGSLNFNQGSISSALTLRAINDERFYESDDNTDVKDPESPGTGDSALWIILAGMVAAAASVMVARRKATR